MHVPLTRHDFCQASPCDSATSASNAAVSLTYGAQQNTRHIINGLAWSYSGGSASGSVQVLDQGVVIFNMDITAAGNGSITFPDPLAGSPGRVLTITLAAGGSSVTGKINALGHRAVQTDQAGVAPAGMDFSQLADSGFIPCCV